MLSKFLSKQIVLHNYFLWMLGDTLVRETALHFYGWYSRIPAAKSTNHNVHSTWEIINYTTLYLGYLQDTAVEEC